MEFSFSNLGIVKEANINLNGITVITGLNDTGKSFISKGIYSIIKTLNESELTINSKRSTAINSLLNQIHFTHRQVIAFTQERLTKFSFAPVIAKVNDVMIHKRGVREEITALVTDFVERTIQDLKDNGPKGNTAVIDHRIKLIQTYQDQINQNLLEQSNADKFEAYFNEEIIQRQFQGQINDINDEKSSVVIKLNDGATELLNFSVFQNKTKINSDYAPVSTIFRDATIIESPIIANLERYITYTRAYADSVQQQQSVQLPNHYIDLTRKINAGTSNAANPFQEILNQIKKIIGGQVVFKPDQGGIVFIKANGSVIRVNNMATGIKSFGILQILLSSGVINTGSLLIIDEPEVHLHPKWEIEYAKLLVLLSKANVQIIVSSHSPYFIQAISRAANAGRAPIIFYFGSVGENEKSSEFTNVTNDLTPILAALAQPFKEMYNINEQRAN